MLGFIKKCSIFTSATLLLLFLSTFPVCSGYVRTIEIEPGTPCPPGSPWPLPQVWTRSPELVTIGSDFDYELNIPDCTPLKWFTEKFNRDYLFGSATPDSRYPTLSRVVVHVSSTPTYCESFPKLRDDESYTLKVEIRKGDQAKSNRIFVVCQNNQLQSRIFFPFERMVETVERREGVADAVATIEAATVWGALRGLATFTQLSFDDLEDHEQNGLHFYLNVTSINDWPRFPHRGLTIDTARHYEPERIIHQIMDSMFYNKLNVFHWHISDDQSFPFVSQRWPELSLKGAFNKKAIYTPEMVQRTLEFGRVRGIRVIFEFDSPGHTHIMGEGYPELLTPCFGDGINPGTPDHPNHAAFQNLDPTKNFTYEFMKELLTEIGEISKDEYVHLGMDEVYMPCWKSSPLISKFMKENGYYSLSQVQEHYTVRILDIMKNLGIKTIVWQDPIEAGVELDKDVVIQIWKDWDGGWEKFAQKALDKGHSILLSARWYINYIDYGATWRKYYKVDPLALSLKPGQKEKVLGGEACIWAEYADKTNILPRLFPFAGAIAERLWSAADASTADDAMWRLDQHRCRMLRRGIPAQPVLDGYCGQWETEN